MINLIDLAKEYLKELSAKRSINTVRQYDVGVRFFIEYVTDKGHDPENITLIKSMFIQYPGWLVQKSGLHKRSIQVYMAAIKSFLMWSIDQEVEGIKDWSFSDNLRFENKVKDAIAMHEDVLPKVPVKGSAEQMIEAIDFIEDDDPIVHARNKAIILFLASSGCRNEETVNLKVSNFDLDNNSVIVFGKGRKERHTFYTQEAKDAILDYWSLRQWADKNDPAFAQHNPGNTTHSHLSTTSVRNIVTRIKKVANVETFSPHKFRHHAATTMLVATHDITIVQEFLGHSNIATTRGYTHVVASDVQEAHKKAFSS